MYNGEKNVTKFYQIGSTYFLDPRELEEVKARLKKNEYSIYYPYKDSEKCILYRDSIPEVLLYEIKSKIELRHQDILGTMYSLNIDSSLFGDILIINNHYYIYILPIVRNYFETNFLMVKNARIELECIPLNTLEEYEREYEKIEIISSSNRIDTIVSTLAHVGRSNINQMIKKKEILLNFDYLKNSDTKLRVGDIFSIKRIGKFKYMGIIKTTKREHYIISIWKYL